MNARGKGGASPIPNCVRKAREGRGREKVSKRGNKMNGEKKEAKRREE